MIIHKKKNIIEKIKMREKINEKNQSITGKFLFLFLLPHSLILISLFSIIIVAGCGKEKVEDEIEKKIEREVKVEAKSGNAKVEFSEEKIEKEQENFVAKKLKMSIIPSGDDADFRVEVSFLWKETGKSKTMERIENKSSEVSQFTGTPFVFVPGVFFKNNMFSDTPYSVEESGYWLLREDRMPIPAVLIWDEGKFFGVIKISEPQKDEGNCETDISSLGFSVGEKKIIFSYPWSEFPNSYTRKTISFELSEPQKCFTKEGKDIELILIYGNGDISQSLKTLWETYFDTKREKIEIRIHELKSKVSIEEIKKSLLKYFERYYAEDQQSGVSGFFSWVNSYNGNVIFNYLESAFTGMVLMNARNAVEIGKEFKRKDIVERGKKVVDSWLEKRVNGFFPDCLELSGEICKLLKFFFDDSFFTRRQFESILSLLAFAKSYKKFVESENPSDIDKNFEKYFDEFVKMSELMLSLQNEDGSFSKRYSFQKEVLDDGKSGSYFAVPVLVSAYEVSGDKKFLESASKVGDFLLKKLENMDIEGSTLDANSVDKEAFLWIMYSLYLLWDKTGEGKYFEGVLKVLYPALTWFFLWDVPFSQKSLFGQIGMKTMGLGSVSVENIHVDVYIFFFPYIFGEIYKETKDERIKIMSELIALSSLHVVPVESDSKGSVVGIVPEVIQQTIWDYGFLGKGNYNISSATGWTVASILSYIYPFPFK